MFDMDTYLPSLVIAAVAIVLIIRKQTGTRRVTPVRMYAIPVIMAVVGLGMVIGLEHARFLDPSHIALSFLLVVAELVIGVVMGFVRAATIRAWRDEQGTAWFRGDGRTVLAWLASILIRVGAAGLGAALGVHSSSGMFMVFFAITLLTQNMIVLRRSTMPAAVRA